MSVLSIVWLLAIAHCLSAAEPTNTSPTSASPFLRFRETTLGYHGWDEDFTNLTEIRIGWFGPTNLNDPLTGDLWWAANLAIREANEPASDPDNSSFVLRPSSFPPLSFRLIPRWAVDPWGTGVSQLTRMVYDEKPLALLGSADSATTHLAEQVVAKANLPLVSPIVTDKSVTLAGVSWMFSCAPSDDAIARVLVDDVLDTLKDSASSPARSSLALLACTDHESRMTTREVLKEFSRRGRMPDFRFDVPPGTQVIAHQMSALEGAHLAGVLIVAGAEDAARLVRAVRERFPIAARSLLTRHSGTLSPTGGEGRSEGAVGCLIFGSHSMSRTRFRELAGSAAEGVRFPLLLVPSPADPNGARFAERFTSEHHRPPDYTAALTYDATHMLIEAIRRAGPNRARIRETLTQCSPWPGIAGPIRFDGTGQNTRTNIGMGTIRNGAVVPLTGRERPTQTARNNPTP